MVSFLESLPPNTIGLDSGAGNGKYIPNAGPSREVIALDRAQGLLDIAKDQKAEGAECLRGELGYMGWRKGVFDWAISVAAIHHLTTPGRRKESVQALILPLTLQSKPPYSRFMIYVWAYEQGVGSKRKMGKAAEKTPMPDLEEKLAAMEVSESQSQEVKGKLEEKVQDVLVPWVYTPAGQGTETAEKKVYHRYYHLFVEGELEDLVIEAAKEDGFEILDAQPLQSESSGTDKWMRITGVGYEADNWWIQAEVGLK